MQAVRDIIVVGIYLVFFGANIALFVKWQDRKTKTEDERREAGRSSAARASVGR